MDDFEKGRRYQNAFVQHTRLLNEMGECKWLMKSEIVWSEIQYVIELTIDGDHPGFSCHRMNSFGVTGSPPPKGSVEWAEMMCFLGVPVRHRVMVERDKHEDTIRNQLTQGMTRGMRGNPQ
jgi:hypothetical protein